MRQLAVILMFLSFAGFQSCKKKNVIDNEQILTNGIWLGTESKTFDSSGNLVNTDDMSSVSMEFKTDYSWFAYDEGEISDDGRWSLDENTNPMQLEIEVYTENKTYVFDVVELNDNTLTLKMTETYGGEEFSLYLYFVR